jgi:antitoxin VapB
LGFFNARISLGISLERNHGAITVFVTNRSQAVRLPKDVAFPKDVHHVEIIKRGNARIITPLGKRWEDFFENGPSVSDDFTNERIDPPPQEREPF